MKNPSMAIALAFLLSGCDAAKDLGTKLAGTIAQGPTTLVIHSGYRVQAGGNRSVPVAGFDECSSDKTTHMLLGYDPDEGKTSCIVIKPDTMTVAVIVGFPEGPVHEVWTVEHMGDHTAMRRADGSYLAQAE